MDRLTTPYGSQHVVVNLKYFWQVLYWYFKFLEDCLNGCQSQDDWDVQKQKRDSEIEPGLTLLGRGGRSGAEVLVVACLVACLKKGDWEEGAEEVRACQSDEVWNSQALNTIQKSVSLL